MAGWKEEIAIATRRAGKTKRTAATAGKLDLYKEHKADDAASRQPAVVQIAPALYLAIEGQGEPGGEAFVEAVGALYGFAFTIKMTRKFAGLGDYKVCALEGLWWGKKADFWNDPRRTAPERLRTILRQPVRARNGRG